MMGEPGVSCSSHSQNLRSAGQGKLLADLKSLVNNAKRSDVVLKCNDGKTVHACRWMLANRSSVFDGMFNNGMLETDMPEISLPSVPSRAMLSVLEFLYTGTIDAYSPCDWRMGFELIRAAQFFLLPTMDLIALDYLKSEFVKACRNEEQDVLMHMLSVGLEFQEAWEGKEAMLQELIFHIHHDWFGTQYSCELSRDAVDYILGNCRHTLDDKSSNVRYELENIPCRCGRQSGESLPSMAEYCIFRNIVLWHVFQVAKDEAVERVTTDFLPPRDSLWTRIIDLPDIDGFVLDPPASLDFGSSTVELTSALGVEVWKDSLEQMLQRYVNLACIPASLLVTVIHPLKVIPGAQLLKALVRATSSRHVQLSVYESAFRWRSQETTIKIDPNGYVTRQGDYRIDADMIVGYIPDRISSSDTYEWSPQWSFTILKDDAASIDVGFICLPRGKYDMVEDIVKKSLRDSPTTRLVCINEKEYTVSISRREPKLITYNWEHYIIEVEADTVVKFSFYEESEACSVEVDDGLVSCWEDLPSECMFLPAICFNRGSSGKVQFRPGSAFNYFWTCK